MLSKFFAASAFLSLGLACPVVFAEDSDRIVVSNQKTFAPFLSEIVEQLESTEGLVDATSTAKSLSIASVVPLNPEDQSKLNPNTLFVPLNSKYVYLNVLGMESGPALYRLQSSNCNQTQLMGLIEAQRAADPKLYIKGQIQRLGVTFKLGRWPFPVFAFEVSQVGTVDTATCPNL